MSFADKVAKAVEEAPSAGFTNVNYGRLTTAVNVLKWVGGKGEPRTPVRTPFREDQELGNGENLELTFTIHISELNPALEFDYERNILIQKSKEDGSVKTDWTETVEPSLVAVFGADWPKIVTGKKALYVAAEHVNSVKLPKEGKKNYGVPKFIEKYNSLEECSAARDARYGKSDGEASDELGIPAAVIEQAKALLKSVKGNKTTLKTMLASNPFGEYDADAIMAELE